MNGNNNREEEMDLIYIKFTTKYLCLHLLGRVQVLRQHLMWGGGSDTKYCQCTDDAME